MKILVVGGGGREHTLVWKLAQSPKVEKIYCAPGNAGISAIAQCAAVGAEDIDGLVALAKEKAVDLVVVGPEAALTMGLVDRLNAEGIKACGPTASAARIEGSKAFSKDLMRKYGIPTGDYAVFDDYEAAKSYINSKGGPLVVKADGLAAGKGVLLCETTDEALDAVRSVMADRDFGDAGDKVLIEEFLFGEEASFLVFTDGKTIHAMPTSQDHKAAFDGDKGPNTGGMGAYSPAPVVTEELHQEIMDKVMRPTVKALAAEGCPFKGFLYAGLMIGPQGIKVLEFNARFGDPECQPLLMKLKSDLVEILEAVADGRLEEVQPEWDASAAVCVVMAAGGYPGKYNKGDKISGLSEAAKLDNVVVFHAGTAFKDGDVVTSGGRVLGVTALGEDVKEAIDLAYQAAGKITWDGAFCRTDIGLKALEREKGFTLQERGFTMHDPSKMPTVRPETALVKGKGGPLVGILMGSDSDAEAMSGAVEVLREFGVSFEVKVASAHRTPDRAADYASSARKRGIKVLIAGAGWAAHLAGAIAAQTILPVIGVPLDSSPLNGMDALLATVQMPPGIPVATVALGKGGAKNAGLLAVQILALSDPSMVEKLVDYKRTMAESVEAKSAKVEKQFSF